MGVVGSVLRMSLSCFHSSVDFYLRSNTSATLSVGKDTDSVKKIWFFDTSSSLTVT